MLTIADALKQSASLSTVSDSARLDTEVILAAVLQKNRTYLYTWPEKALSENEVMHFDDCMQQRQSGKPVAYIIGEREFWSLTLAVNSSTLIPRPDTELLVELALGLFDTDEPRHANQPSRRVIDLGTGTGAIALSLATEKPHWSITAVDYSEEACQLAEYNRTAHRLNNVSVVQSHWLDNVTDKSVDMIVTNPPYIDAKDPHLAQGDVRFEPRSALVADDNGLSDIRIIAQQSTQFLAIGGWLLMEHGYQQAAAVRDILSESHFTACHSEKDMSGHERVTMGQFLGKNS